MYNFIGSLTKIDFLIFGVVGISAAIVLMMFINKAHSKKIENPDQH